MHNTRRNILKRLSLAGVWAGLGMPALGAASTHKLEQAQWTGADDRAYWAQLLYKIARPVVENLAEGTLKARMPVEVAPNYTLKAEKVTHLEAIGRTVAGLAPWLELPDDATEEGVMQTLLDAGATVLPNSCGACAGYGATFPEGSTVISTTARNFKGRMGPASVNVYLASPYTVAASALRGRISDAREVLA